MIPMSTTVKAAREALDAAKRDGAFVNRYLDGDRETFATMQRLMRAAYPDEAPGETRDAVDDSAFGPAMTAAPTGDGGGGAMPEWLLKAGDAGFAPPKSPAHYNFEYAPHVEIDPEFDRLARDWMYKAELPAGWSAEIARDYQRRAAKPPLDIELAAERDAVLGRLRKQWGEAADAKLAQVRDLVHGIGDDRLIETLNRSGLGNNEWLIRQLAIFADRKAMKAKERNKSGADEDPEPSGDTAAGYRDLVYRPGDSDGRGDGGSADSESDPYVQLSAKSDKPAIGETVGPEIVPMASTEDSGPTEKPGHKGHSGGGKGGGGGGAVKLPYSDIPIPAATGTARQGEPPSGPKPPAVNLGRDRHASIIGGTPARFDIADNPDAVGSEPSYAAHSAGFVQVDLHRYVIEAEARKQGVDSDLVKAIMYVENAQGNYFGLARVAEGLGLAKSLFPMNIRPSIWHRLGYTEEQFKDPRLNIRAAVTLLKRIVERIENPTIAKVATLWNSLPKEKVSDFGARVAEVYKAKSWEKP